MEFNQLKQYGTTIHEDTPDTSTPVAKMIPSVIDAKYARLFLASPDLYEALDKLIEKYGVNCSTATIDRGREALAKARGE